MLTETVLTITLVLLGSAYAIYKRLRDPRRDRVPPGPPGKPIIGNILDFALRHSGTQWVKLIEYKSLYGDIVFFHGFRTHILVLNSLRAIDDLFEKRPLIYSDRPSLTVAGDLMGLNYSAAFMRHGKEWREYRHMEHFALGARTMRRYHTRLEDTAALLNLDLLDNPTEFTAHVRLMAARLALSVTYGMSIGEAGRDYISHAEKTMNLIRNATVPGAYLTDFLPILKYLPSCFPFHQHAARGRAMIDYLITMPFEYVKQRMEEGTAPDSLTKDLLLQCTTSDDIDLATYEHRIKWIAGTNYAGTEGISTIILTFLLAMSLYPDKQKLAQQEIDLVVGTDRMPMIADRESCPYVGALIKETMRWNPTFPLGISRCTQENDVYRGYFIPKGTIVVPNSWAIAFSPNEKYNPDSFIPERFLDPNSATVDSHVWAFGYGRRMCPGKTLAENALDVLIPNVLAAFDILPPEDGVLDSNAEVQISKPQLGLSASGDPYKCRIVPRSRKAKKMVRKRAACSQRATV